MDHRLSFVIGDFLASVCVGLLAGLIAWAVVEPGWNMWLAMIITMALGMIAGFFLFFAVTFKLGAMEAMVSIMFSGMLSGMVVGMAAAMTPMPMSEALTCGGASGLAGIVIIWIANSLLRGVTREA